MVVIPLIRIIAGVFAEEEQGEGHRRVLDEIARDELGLAFGQVEGRAVGLGQRRDEEDDEHRESGMANHTVFCASTMSDRFSEPTQSSTVMMTKPIETS